jgi:hypothetical protein
MKKIILSTLLLIMLTSLVYAASSTISSGFYSSTGFSSVSSTSTSYTQGFNSYYSSSALQTYWPILSDQDNCLARQDILLQVAPAGCQPTVVRSDILAEQNVPVFCQIDALTLNPLIDIKEIKNIGFSGNYPKEVAGTGFHPAQAALRTRDTLLGSPLINNVGYAVVILRKNQNESSLPDFVNISLRGVIDYDIENALGVGRAEFVLEPTSDTQWSDAAVRNKNSFWQGRYFLRLEEVDENYATVSIYSGDRLLSSAKVKRGEVSREIYLPGFYCKAALQISYDGFIEQERKASIEIGSDEGTDILQLYKGSNFLNSKCKILDIIPDKVRSDAGNVSISCSGQRIDLQLRLPGNGLFDVFIDKDNKTITPSQMTYPDDKSYLTVFIGGEYYGLDSDNNFVKVIEDLPQIIETKDLDKSSTKDLNLTKLKYALIEYKSLVAERGIDVANNLIDEQYAPDKEKTFNEAITSYEKIADDYPAEKNKLDGGYSFGERALQYSIELAKSYNKWQTYARLIQKYQKIYPSGEKAGYYKEDLNKYNTIDPSKSANVVYVDNKYKTIRLLSIEEPKKKAGVDFSWGSRTLTVNKGESIELSGIGNITLDSMINTDSVRITSRCLQDTTTKDSKGVTQTTKRTITTSSTVKIDQIQNVCGETLKLERVNLERVAKIRLTPSVKGPRTETNLTVVIGIEKRNIQLTPEETKDRIKILNESIEKFDKISTTLGKVVTGLKGACFATAGVLTIKNFITGMDGSGLARQQAMRGIGGWNDKCNQMINDGKYKTLTQCYNANSAEIEQTVKERAKGISEVNGVLKGFEKDHTKTGEGIFGGSYVEREPVVKEYRNYLLDKYGDRDLIDPNTNQKVNVSELLKNENGYKNGEYGYEQLRDLHLNLQLQQSSNVVTQNISQYDGWTIASQIKDNQNLLTTTVNTEKWQKAGLPAATSVTPKNQQNINAQVVPVTDEMRTKYFPQDTTGKVKYMSIVTAPATSTASVNSLGKETSEFSSAAPYAVGLEKSSAGTNYGVVAVTKLKDNSGQPLRDQSTSSGDGSINAGTFSSTYQINSVTSASDVSCVNRYKNAKIKYYDNEPYKGLPALVPFDLNKGWYVATKPVTSGFGNIGTYKSSGEINSFYICNVGRNGMEQFLEGARDDICQLINTGTGQSLSQFSCIASETEGKKLINVAMAALQQAAEQQGNSLVTVNVGGRGSVSMKPEATTSAPSTQCQDTMSPGDCKTLFNVCDPVICPASRCNFGGQYQVADVIQSGVVGSLLLCAPNIKEGIMLPVCLTGVKSGLDAYISLLKGHRDCLQESLNSSQMLGVCDEIYSIYTCEFFWSQTAPIVSNLLPKLIEFGSGNSGARGGGEYQNIAGAWSNAEKSVNYFTQTYAVNSMNAFKIRSIDEAGTTFCRAYLSGVGPNTFESLIEPDSPSQFYARFDTFKFSDATVPATSQYKVFYHIFAGNDAGVYYSIYLKNPPQTSYYYSTAQIQVASGFIVKGQYRSETKDFTAPEGYKELCVRINDKEECGFQEVSTSFAVNYVSDTLAAQEIQKSGITSQSECISGGANVGSLLNPNLQAGVSQTINPATYNNGIIRVCATQNPGRSTDPTRYSDVGFCDDQTMRCWLDKRSVTNAIGSENIELTNSTLQSITANQISALQASGDLLSENDANTELKSISDAKNALKNSFSEDNAILLIQRIDSTIIKLYQNHHKAWAYLTRAEVKEAIARNKRNQITSTSTSTSTATATTTVPTTTAETKGFELTKSDGDRIYVLFNGEKTSLYIKGEFVYDKDMGQVGTYKVSTLKLINNKVTSNDLDVEYKNAFGEINYNQLIGAGFKITNINLDIPGTTTPTATIPSTTTFTLTLKDIEGKKVLTINDQQSIISIDDSAGIVNAFVDDGYIKIGSKTGSTYSLDSLDNLSTEQLNFLKLAIGDKVFSDLENNQFSITSDNKIIIQYIPEPA